MVSVENLAGRLENVWFENVRLKVNKAKFSREEKQQPMQVVEVKKGSGGALITPSISFKSVVAKDKGKVIVVEEEEVVL